MKSFLLHIAFVLYGLGGIGLLIMGVLDSSFLFMPLGNDLLMVALTVRHESRMPYYAIMATIGSVGGVLIIDALSRKGGEKGLEGRVSPGRLAYIKRKMEKRAGWAIAVACLMPPPFPFTPFVIAAAALQYPRKKLLSIIAAARAIRFTGAGVLAMIFGRRIIRMAGSPVVEYVIVGLVIVSIVGSGLSIYSWIRRSKGKTGAVKTAGGGQPAY